MTHSWKFARSLSGKKVISVMAGCLLFLVAVFLPLEQAQAKSGIELSTDYPGVITQAGESLTFPLQLKNNLGQGQVLRLTVGTVPENWQTSFRGNGREVQQVYVSGYSYGSVDLKVTIPDQVKAGDYALTVTAASGQGYRESLKLNIRIEEAGQGEDELVAQYSELKGPGDATFNFKLDLTNNGGKEQVYSLGAKVPEGWQVAFKPSYESQQVASISVGAGKTQGLDVMVTPSASVEAGEYTIPVKAVSSAGTAEEELKIIISGTYDIKLTTPSGRLNADLVAGQEKKINLKVINKGSAPLNNISFSSSEPQDWSVTFEPKTIDVLKAGESRQITATITASSKAIAGDYVVSMRASTRETADNSDLRVTVRTSTLWGVVALILVLLVVTGVYWAFRTYGRR